MPISYVGFLKTYILSLRRLIVVCFYCSLYKSNIYSFSPASRLDFIERHCFQWKWFFEAGGTWV